MAGGWRRSASERASDPILYRTFIGDGRQRHWARAVVGWPTFRALKPNAAHHALAQLEQHGALYFR